MPEESEIHFCFRFTQKKGSKTLKTARDVLRVKARDIFRRRMLVLSEMVDFWSLLVNMIRSQQIL